MPSRAILGPWSCRASRRAGQVRACRPNGPRRLPSRAGAQHNRSASKRVPGRPAGVLEIADVGTEPQADAGADRGDDHVLVLLECYAHATHQVGRAVDPAETLIDLLGIAQVVDEHHHLGAFGAGIVADRRPLPVDAMAAGILGVEDALPIAQAGHEGTGRFLAQDVAVGAALLLEHVLDHAGEPLADRAEEAVAGGQDLSRGVAAVRGLLVARRTGLVAPAVVGRAIAAVARVLVGLGGRRVGLAIGAPWR